MSTLKQQAKKGVYWAFFEKMSNYGIQFVIGIFMARLLSPEDYGITALPAIFMGISGIFIEGGFGTALIRKPDLKDKDLSTAFIYSISVGIFCYFLIFAAAPYIADFYNTPILIPIIRVTAISYLYSPFGTPQSVLLARRLDFKTGAKVSVITRLFAGCIGILLAFMGYGVWALVISGMVSGITGIVLKWIVVRWYPTTGWSKESFKYLWGYGNKIMGSYLLGVIYENIAPIFIGKYYSPKDLGIYNRAEGYAKLPSQNITYTIQGVTFPVLSKIQDNDEKLARVYRKMLRLTAFVVFPIMMMLSALSRPFIIVMITEKWTPSIILLQIICFSMMWYPIHAINLNLLEVKGRSDLFFRLEVIKKMIGLLVMIVSLPLGLVAFCLGNCISSLLCLIVNTYYTGKIIHVGYVRQMKDLLHIIVMSIAMYSAICLVNSFISDILLQLIVGILVGFCTYMTGSYIFRFSELEDLKFMLKRRE